MVSPFTRLNEDISPQQLLSSAQNAMRQFDQWVGQNTAVRASPATKPNSRRRTMTNEAIQILLTLAFGIAFGLIVGWVLALMWEKRK
jgi:hypothetical protein